MNIARCESCEKDSLHLSNKEISEYAGSRGNKAVYIFLEDIDDLDAEIFYSVPTSFFTVDSRIPVTIRELITEAEGCLKMNYLTGASACMRKANHEMRMIS